MKISDRTYGFLMNVPGLLIVFLWFMFPAVLLVVTSFLRYDNLNPIVFYGFKNYIRLFNDRLFGLSLSKVAIFTTGTTLLTYVGGMIFALALTGIRKGSALFRSMLIIPWAVPPIVSGIVWRWIFSPDFGVLSDILIKLHLIAEPLPPVLA